MLDGERLDGKELVFEHFPGAAGLLEGDWEVCFEHAGREEGVEELFGAGQKSAPVTPDIVEKPELNEAPLTEALVHKTGSFPGVQGDQPSQILHPKNAITIGAGLRANLNNTVSLRDLKK